MENVFKTRELKNIFMPIDLLSKFHQRIIILSYDCFLQQHFFHDLCTQAL